MNASASGGEIARHRSRRLGASTACRVALIAAILLALAPCAAASAASPSRVQKKAYRIRLMAIKGELAVTNRQVNQGAAAEQHHLAPCLSALKGWSVPQGAAQALQTELAGQYTAIALRPLLEVLIAEDTRTEQLPIRPRLKAALQVEVTHATAMFQINTCADVAAWQAAGFARSSERPARSSQPPTKTPRQRTAGPPCTTS